MSNKKCHTDSVESQALTEPQDTYDETLQSLGALSAEDKIDLVKQTAKIPWAELERFFAAGKVIEVEPPLNLVTVGLALKDDDVAQFNEWINANKIAPINDESAQLLHDQNASVWALAVAPWVLIQKMQIPKV